MRTKFAIAVLIITIALAAFSSAPVCLAQESEVSYELLNHLDGNVAYQLNVIIPQQLHGYYHEKSHDLPAVSNYPDFVTPYALKPIADRLREIYVNDEDFANGVLMIVHQITYEETTPIKYPVETMAEGKGDCDLFATIAASILEAGGLDTVLLYYEKEAHMNIGIHLSQAPRDDRDAVYAIMHDGGKYYIAECTGGNWRDGWRVGECPSKFKQVSSQVISLENAEQIAPGQVSASFTAMEPSALSLEVAPIFTFQTSEIAVRGQLAPQLPDENVTLYVKTSNSPWAVIGTVLTGADGSFAYVWKTETAGLFAIQAGWSGDRSYTGAMSDAKSATIIPLFLGALIAIGIIAAVVGVLAAFMSKHTRQHSQEPEESPLSAFTM